MYYLSKMVSEQLKEGDDYFSKEDKVFEIYVSEIKKSLDFNDNTFADATHLNERSRAKLLKALKENLLNIEVNAIYFKTPLDVCLARNEQREGLALVPREQVRKMFYSMTEPLEEEGFKNVFLIK